MNHIPDATKMARADSLAMAREAGICNLNGDYWDCTTDHIVALTVLARADERERLLDGMEMPEPAIQASLLMPEKGGLYGPCYTADQLRETVAAAVARKDAEIEQLTDRLDSSVHGHNQMFDLGKLFEAERDALKAEVERLKSAVADEREKSLKLWMLLDDVDTADDIAKTDDAAYRSLCRQAHGKRWNVMTAAEVDAAIRARSQS